MLLSCSNGTSPGGGDDDVDSTGVEPYEDIEYLESLSEGDLEEARSYFPTYGNNLWYYKEEGSDRNGDRIESKVSVFTINFTDEEPALVTITTHPGDFEHSMFTNKTIHYDEESAILFRTGSLSDEYDPEELYVYDRVYLPLSMPVGNQYENDINSGWHINVEQQDIVFDSTTLFCEGIRCI